MRCQACDKNLTDREASRKFLDWREIKDPEQRYIMLCEKDLKESGLQYEENPRASDEEVQDEDPQEVEDQSDT